MCFMMCLSDCSMRDVRWSQYLKKNLTPKSYLARLARQMIPQNIND